MARPLRVLILEDRPADAELALHELRRAGFEPDYYPFPQYRSRCLAEGADFLFDKSTELDQVAGALGELARRGAANQG